MVKDARATPKPKDPTLSFMLVAAVQRQRLRDTNRAKSLLTGVFRSCGIAARGLSPFPARLGPAPVTTVRGSLAAAHARARITARVKPKAKFDAMQRTDRPDWYVRLTLPAGRQSWIDGFKTQAEARNWITAQSVAWLKMHESCR